MEEIAQRAPGLSYPRVIKWSNPNEVVEDLEKAGLTLHKCEYAHSAKELIEKLRPYAKINQFPLVQEYCPGKGIGQMFLVHEGEILLQFQHQRVHEWPPEGGVSTLCKSLSLSAHQACRERSESLLRALRWTGVAMVEYRYDHTTDTYYFMEINGRFWGSLPLAIAAGVPFAAGLVQSTKKNAATIKQPDYAELYCRFMIPEIRRLARLLLQPDQIQDPYYRYSRLREFSSFVFNFFRPGTRYYLFSVSDPGPFMADLKNIVAKTLCRRG
jgi:predicted ATP-grasp superfamily ATP-dependent carboligase